jgi:hypothetical protein
MDYEDYEAKKSYMTDTLLADAAGSSSSKGDI